jgi:xanthine dehydrogenase accessory factor
MKFWTTIKQELEAGHSVALMIVLHSEGSSPGRQGFKMLVSDSGLLFGSIGGGIMEHKLVEFCKDKVLADELFRPLMMRQIHKDSIAADKSGMICSGEQTIAFYQLDQKHKILVDNIEASCADRRFGTLHASELGLDFSPSNTQTSAYTFEINADTWRYEEDLGAAPHLHIVGGGHVGLALSKFAYQLGFTVVVYDDRANLNTVARNNNASAVIVDDYKNIAQILPAGARHYVVLMSFGYRTDKVVLQSLLNHNVPYLGMMGSKEKVQRLFAELREEGATEAQLERIYSPIGIQIASKTPEEIAISILAEIIAVKNSS